MPTDFSDYIEFDQYYLPHLKNASRKGDEITACCPFHEEEQPSWGANVKTGLWKCFGCGAGGDVVTFEARLNGISNKEAFAKLCEKYKISSRTSAQKRAAPKPSSAPTVPLPSLDALPGLPLPDKARDYLVRRRGWSPEAIEKYRIGYLARDERISIPVLDEKGRLVNIRRYRPGAGENKFFHWAKGYGQARLYPVSVLDEARAQGKPVILCEGEPDALCGLSHGLFCVTQTAGASTWRKEWNGLFKGLEVIIAYDQDEPGRTGAVKVAQALAGSAAKVEILEWPACVEMGEDLTDWFVKHGRTVEDFFEIFRREVKASKQDTPRADNSDKIVHMDVARDVVEGYEPGNLIFVKGMSWKWNGKGVWEEIEKTELKQKVTLAAPQKKITGNIVGSIVDLVQNVSFRPNHRFDVDRTTINCRNGELAWTGLTWELRPHSREHFRTTQLPIPYQRKAGADRFLRFLEEIFIDDEDKTEKAQVIKEGIGYSLLSTCEFEKFFLLIGEGSNGKSILMTTIKHLVGLNHAAAVQPSQFENKFQRAHLFGKLVNLVTEVAEGHEIADAQLKAIVSGELTTAERKHQPPFDFEPYCTCWFGTNHMPHTRDFSDALFRRAIVLSFNRKFREGGDAENRLVLENALRAELPGILNLALEALAGVFARKCFTEPASCREAKLEWRLNCDQVAQFIEDKCEIDSQAEVTSGNLYKAYQEWANEVGVRKQVNRKNFTQRLMRLGVEAVKGTGGTRMIHGITIVHRF